MCLPQLHLLVLRRDLHSSSDPDVACEDDGHNIGFLGDTEVGWMHMTSVAAVGRTCCFSWAELPVESDARLHLDAL